MDKEKRKEKWENFWYYYKVHTIVGIFVVIIIIYSIASAMARKDSILNVTILGGYLEEEKRVELQDQATKVFAENPEKQEVTISFNLFDNELKDPASMAIQQKIVAMSQVGELDVLILDKEQFKRFSEFGLFIKLDDVKGLKNQNMKFVKSKVKDSDTQEYSYGIDIENSKILKSLGYDTKDKILGLGVNSEKVDTSVAFAKWILGK
jgi:spermidine/putrescine-binding protein